MVFPRKTPAVLFIVLFVIASLMTLISADEQLVDFLKDTVFHAIFVNSLSGNSIIFNVSIGYIVSTIFYFIVVYLPERRKKKDLAPHVGEKIENIISRVNSLIAGIVKESGEILEVTSISKIQMKESCLKVNPKTMPPQQFHNGGVDMFTNHFGYSCFNHWQFVLSNIDEVMRFLPFVDTGIIAILNRIKGASLNIDIGMLKDFDRLKNEDLEPWANSFHEAMSLSQELAAYYGKHVNKSYKNPYVQ